MRSFFLTVLLFSNVVFSATESGYIFRGKRYVTYREGVKVGKSFSAMYPKESKDRGMASSNDQTEKVIHYVKDNTNFCYHSTTSLSCVKR